MSRNMSTLESLAPTEEKLLLKELHDYLNVNVQNEIEVWPNEFLKSKKIIESLTERELKILNIDYGIFLKNIARFHPKLLFSGDVEDIRYDFGPGPKQIKETVRIRRKKDYYTMKEWYLLTIKKKNVSKDIKEREEFEVPITNIDSFDRMFRAMSLLPINIKEKVRSTYAIKDAVFDIDVYYDKIHNIPPVLEIEGKNEGHIRERIDKLELGDHRVVNWSSRQLLKHYRQWPSVQNTSHELAKNLSIKGSNSNGKQLHEKQQLNGKNGKGKK